MPINDSESALGLDGVPPTDPHGQAALILVESLMHGLIERSVMSSDEAIDVVETALTVQAEVATIADGAAPAMWRSHTLLSAIAASLKTAAVI